MREYATNKLSCRRDVLTLMAMNIFSLSLYVFVVIYVLNYVIVISAEKHNTFVFPYKVFFLRILVSVFCPIFFLNIYKNGFLKHG